MTVEQLRNVHRAQPLRPFTIHLGDGRAFLCAIPTFYRIRRRVGG